MMSQHLPAVLLLAFKRLDSVAKILEVLRESGVTRLYVAIDRASDDQEIEAQIELIKLLESNRRFFNKLLIAERKANVGCAVSVLSGLDWVFRFEEFVAVLEDDCLPTIGFFQFVIDSKHLLDNNEDLMLICGTQFAPSKVTNNVSVKSNYSLTWGWASSREKWKVLREDFFTNPTLFQKGPNRFLRGLFDSEYVYWQAGRRRAIQGYVDVWDTILVSNLKVRNQFAILPGVSLIENVGSDIYATHTKVSAWTNIPAGIYESRSVKPGQNREVDSWLKNQFFKIKFRHILSTRLTKFLDLFRKSKRGDLLSRWLENQIKVE